MPKLVRLYLRQVLIGYAIAAAFVAALLWFDVAGLRHLVFATADGPLAAFLLVTFNGIVFSGVQFGIVIMRMARDADPRGGTRARRSMPLPAAVPVPVEARPARGG